MTIMNSNQPNAISAATLPPNRNFTWLKKNAIEHIKQLSVREWTNYNDSDPGVTIVEQLCYALTELGYCNHFPIEDVLCRKSGAVPVDNQFYLPQELLTTAPVTIDDYRKCLLNDLPELANVYINLNKDLQSTTGEIEYQCYLYPDPEQPISKEQSQTLIEKAFNQLNQNRPIGERFARPILLTSQTIKLEGQLYLTPQASPSDVMNSIRQALQTYISPSLHPSGYQEMLALGYHCNEIFNGPQLNEGWIPTLQAEKLTTINGDHLSLLIGQLEGIQAIELNTFKPIVINTRQIAAFDISCLGLYQHNAAVSKVAQSDVAQQGLDTHQVQTRTLNVGASIDIAPALPTGEYRDISRYYSVQNTFPAFYRIGSDALGPNASDFSVAQTRQLKGYLMVFDQMLANQFSQLDQIGELFSFTRTQTQANEAGEAFPELRFQSFASSYFYQPLYSIPDVKPLLIGNNSYNFRFGTSDKMRAGQKQWLAYQKDPFNRYMNGLRESMETPSQSNNRRHRMLDHLLARHGESGEFYNSLITEAQVEGSLLRTRIDIKSRLLQNYQLLSYYRTKGFDFLNANDLGTTGRFRLTPKSLTELTLTGFSQQEIAFIRPFINIGFNHKNSLLLVLRDKYPFTHDQYRLIHALIEDGNQPSNPFKDLPAWEAQQFSDYSAFELKTNLILGLSQHYQMLSQILGDLIRRQRFTKWLTSGSSSPLLIVTPQGLSVSIKSANQHNNKDQQRSYGIWLENQRLLTITGTQKQLIQLSYYQRHKDQLDWLAQQMQGFIFIEPLVIKQQQPLPQPCGQSIFPAYVERINQPLFIYQLAKLSEASLAAHLTSQLVPMAFGQLETVIAAFIAWRNGLKAAGGSIPVKSALVSNLTVALEGGSHGAA